MFRSYLRRHAVDCFAALCFWHGALLSDLPVVQSDIASSSAEIEPLRLRYMLQSLIVDALTHSLPYPEHEKAHGSVFP